MLVAQRSSSGASGVLAPRAGAHAAASAAAAGAARAARCGAAVAARGRVTSSSHTVPRQSRAFHSTSRNLLRPARAAQGSEAGANAAANAAAAPRPDGQDSADDPGAAAYGEEEGSDLLRPEYEDLSDEQVRSVVAVGCQAWCTAGAPPCLAPTAAAGAAAADAAASCRPRLLRVAVRLGPPSPLTNTTPPSNQSQPNRVKVADLVDAAAGLISVLPELRPLDPATFNAAYEVWRAIAAVPPGERFRIIEELEPGAIRNLWKASVGR